jgi:CHAD domain-containing protein
MIEREVKLGAVEALVLPDFSDVLPRASVLTLSPQRLTATYYDTADLRLARWGISVRYRVAESPGRPAVSPTGAAVAANETPWTVKFPDRAGADGPGLVRTEHNFAGPEGQVPAPLLRLLGGYLRGAPLAVVARLRTERVRHVVRDKQETPLVEIDDDDVTVLAPSVNGRDRAVVARFRELEAELVPGAPVAVLEEVVRRLRKAGAGAPDPTPKVVRALGPVALEPPEVAVPAVGPKSPTGDVVRAAIAASVVRLLAHDAGIRISDEDPEDIHQARVASRRLRSDLRTFRSLLDPEWTARVRDELRWVAALLGAVRDADVLAERLRDRAASLPPADAKAGAALARKLEAQRDQSRADLLEAIDTPRYAALLDVLVEAANAVPLVGNDGGTGHRHGGGDAPDPSLPAADVIPGLVRGPWRHLKQAVEALDDEPADDDLHQVRIHAKRCRYAIEAAIPVAGKEAKRLSQVVAHLQGILGDFHDAVVAEQWLREAVARGPVVQALVAGQFIAVERRLAEDCRQGWAATWETASTKHLRAWLKQGG